MSLHLNLSTGKFLNSSTLFKLSDALVLDVSSGEIVMSNLLVPRAVSVSSSPTLFGDATLDLNFASSLSLDDAVSGNNLVTFSRASTGTYVGSDGLIKTTPVNYLRESIGLVTGWINSPANFIRTANYATAPDGTQTATRLQTQSGLVDPGLSAYTTRNYRPASIDYGVGTQITVSVYVKPITTTSTYPIVPPDGAPVQERDLFFWIQVEGGIGQFWFNLNTKETKAGSTAVDVGNGWWRFSVTGTTTTSDATNNHFVYLSNRTAASFDPYPDGNEEVYVWGIQSEIGPTATTYIPTTSTIGGAPRFDHDPVTLQSLGLLVEESRTNYVTTSEDLTGWSTITAGDGVTPTAQNVSATAPNNGSTVTEITLERGTANTNNYSMYRSQFGTTTASTGSVYFKAARPQDVGKVVNFYQNQGAPQDITSVTLTNAWQRVSSVGVGGTVGYLTIGLYNSTASAGEVKVLAWGAQAEQGSFPTSYIPTTGSAVTRAADVASITGTNFSSWYNQSEGTVFVDSPNFPEHGNRVNSAFIYISDAAVFAISTGDGIKFGTGSPQTYNRLQIAEAGALQADSNNPQASKFAIALSENDFSYVIDGTSAGTDNTVVMPTGMDRLAMTGYGPGLAHISRLTYFPTRKSDEGLVSLTLPTVITYGITSPGGVFNLRSTGTVDYEVDWELTGVREASTENVLPHTYTAGDYTLAVYSDGVYRPYFANVTDDSVRITSVVIGGGANLGTNLTNAWRGTPNMTSFVCPFDVTSGVTIFSSTWRSCGITSFPLINTSSGTNFGNAWNGCTSLTSFPLINTSSGTSFGNAWYNCTSLTSFPLIDTSSGTNFSNTWKSCGNLASFPANTFDTTGTLVASAFTSAWTGCALTAQSIENILVSLDTNGATGITLGIDGGTNAAKTTWSAAAVTAYDNLVVKGWTISFNA